MDWEFIFLHFVRYGCEYIDRITAKQLQQSRTSYCGTGSCIYCCISNGFCSLKQFCWWLLFTAALFWESIQLACKQTTEDISNRCYICIYSKLSAALSAKPPQPIQNTCCNPVNNIRQDFILHIVKNASTETLGNSVWEILVHFSVFFPPPQNLSSLESEL